MKDIQEDSSKKIELDGWVEADEEVKKNYPTICPKCGKKLRTVNSLQYCGWFMVWCEDSKCRYCEIYEE
jgi:ssDNA-binding Zn-finger/Zn-ribbon topoisomerase 1